MGAERQARKYGLIADEYRRLHNRYIKVLDIFSRDTFRRILDIGCGDGRFSALLKKASSAEEVYGIEMEEEKAELAKRVGVKAFCMNIDKENFPFEDAHFDAIFAGEVIEHVMNPDHLLAECYRTLKPAGILLLTTPNLASLHNRIALLFGFQPYATTVSLRYRVGYPFEKWSAYPEELSPEESHIRVFTLRTLIRLLKLHMFTVLNAQGAFMELPDNTRYPFFLIGIKKVVDAVSNVFPALSFQVIVLCKKNEMK